MIDRRPRFGRQSASFLYSVGPWLGQAAHGRGDVGDVEDVLIRASARAPTIILLAHDSDTAWRLAARQFFA
jgi:predicted nuclease of predicted toxin-antitoxin system